MTYLLLKVFHNWLFAAAVPRTGSGRFCDAHLMPPTFRDKIGFMCRFYNAQSRGIVFTRQSCIAEGADECCLTIRQ